MFTILFALSVNRSIHECTFDLMRASKLYTLYFVNIVFALHRYGSLSHFLKILLHPIRILENTELLQFDHKCEQYSVVQYDLKSSIC